MNEKIPGSELLFAGTCIQRTCNPRGLQGLDLEPTTGAVTPVYVRARVVRVLQAVTPRHSDLVRNRSLSEFNFVGVVFEQKTPAPTEVKLKIGEIFFPQSRGDTAWNAVL